MQGKDIGLLDGAGIDALMALDLRQRRQPVAVTCGAFEIEISGGSLHGLCKLGPDPVRPAGQEVPCFLHQTGIIRRADLARAGRRAALDLMQETGPGAILVEGRCRCGSGRPAATC